MKRILIVDDSAFMRSILKDLLLANTENIFLNDDIELFEADGKENALKELNKIQPDLIFLDIVMRESETEGLDFVEKIKNFYNIDKIIMISSIGQTAIVERCKKLGIKRYLQKPFEYKEIIETVKSALEE